MAILKSSSGYTFNTDTQTGVNPMGESFSVPSDINKANANNSNLNYNITTPTYNNYSVNNSGLDASVNSAVNSYKNYSTSDANKQSEIDQMRTDLLSSYKDLFDVNTEIGNVGNSVDRTEQNKAKKLADKYTSDIENEQLSLRRKVEALKAKNPEGTFGGALDTTIAEMERKSLSKQADLALLQTQATRDYETLSNIADQQVKNNLSALQAKSDNLKLYIQLNQDYFDKKEQRLYDEEQKKLDNELKKQEDAEESIKTIKLTLAQNGKLSQSVLSALANIDTTKPNAFNEALKISKDYLATSENEIRELANGNTVVIDKRTGRVINNIGGGKAPSVVTRSVNGTPVSGYTMIAGDDPYFIAQQYGITVDELKRLNPNVKDWNNIQVGATLNVPQPEQDAFIQSLKATEGGSKLTDTSIQKLDKGLTVLNQLGVLQSNVEGVKTGPLAGAFKSANPWDTQGQTIKAQLNAIVPNLARGVYGEVGVLTDNDIRTYSQTIPNLKSTEEVRNAVLYITLDMIGKSIKNTLSVNAAAGRDVSGFTDIYTEMENTKNSILSQIPNAQVPQAFNKKEEDPFLNQFSPGAINSAINNSDFFNQF